MRRGIEIDEIAAAHIDGADAESHFAGVDAVEVDEALQGGLERPRIIEARCFRGAIGVQPARELARQKEVRRAVHQRQGRTRLIEQTAA